MKNIILSLLAVFVMVACSCSPTINLPGARMPPQENEAVLYNSLNASVALIKLDENGQPFVYCSGTYLENGKIITANHCIDDTDVVLIGTFLDYIMMNNSFKRLVVYQVEDYNETQDIALLSLVEGQIPSFHTTVKLSQWTPFYGQKVFVIGNPISLHFSLSQGNISFPRRIMDNGQVWSQTTATTYFGNSGGGMFDESGDLMGVASFIYGRNSSLAGFTHIESIREFIE